MKYIREGYIREGLGISSIMKYIRKVRGIMCVGLPGMI